MMHERFSALLTSDPIEPAPVDLSNVSSIAPEHQDSIMQTQDSIKQKFDYENLSDSEIHESVVATVNFYIDLYEDSTVKALRYLGIDGSPKEEIGSGDYERKNEPENPYKKRIITNSAFSYFYDAVKAELQSMGAPADKIEVELEKLTSDYIVFANGVKEELESKLSRLKLVASGFGNPDILRAEAKDASLAYLEELVIKIEAMGERPEREKLAKRIGRVINGGQSRTREEFDASIDKRLAKYKDRTAEELLEEYAKNAMLHYAKAIYGATPFIATKGLESDPIYLYDSFQAQTHNVAEHQRPLTPEDFVAQAVSQKISTILYHNKDWDNRFNTYGSTAGNQWRRREREYRRRIFTNDNFGYNSSNEGNLFEKHNQKSTVDPLDERTRALSESKRQIMIAFSRTVASIPDRNLNDETKRHIDALKADFIARLEVDEDDTTIEKVIRSAMSNLHPDRAPEQDNAVELFKLYVLIKISAKSSWNTN